MYCLSLIAWSESSTAAFLERVGLALPRIHAAGKNCGYMQQATLRLPVSLATASVKAQAAASNAEGHVASKAQAAATKCGSTIARSVGDVSEVASSGGAHSAASSDNQTVLWLVLQVSR